MKKFNYENKLYYYSGLTIAAYVILMLGAAISLIFVFDFPDILREPIDVMLAAFNNNRVLVVPSYYLFVISGIAFIFMVILVGKSVESEFSPLGLLALVSGILFGLTSNLGFIRWPFLMDYLSSTFNHPETTQMQKEMIKISFESFHNYTGVAVGENFAFWFEGFWTIFISILVKKRHDIFPKYIRIIGIPIGIGMLIYTLEQFGGPFAILGEINMLIHSGFLVWLTAIAILLVKRSKMNDKPELGKVISIILIIFFVVLLLTSYI